MLVSGGRLHRPARLRVRERLPGGHEEAAEAAAPRSVASEHILGVVRELGVRRVRGREVTAELVAYGSGGTLAELMSRRRSIGGGEAATVLLGVAAGVAALHAAGWARPGLGDRDVAFAADGCPALAALDGVAPLSPENAVADAEAFHAFAHRLCLRVADGTGMRLLGAVEGALRTGSWRAVQGAIPEVTPPSAVRLGTPGVEDERREGVAPGASVPRPLPTAGVARRLGSRVVAAVESLDGHPMRSVLGRLVALFRRRPALAVAAGLPLAAALALVVAVPGSGAAEPSERAPARSSARDANGAEVPGAVGATGGRTGRQAASGSSDGPDAGKPGSRPDSRSTAAAPGADAASATVGAVASDGAADDIPDDPVDAARSLLDARHACFAATAMTGADVAASCLDAVLDPSAGLLAGEKEALGPGGADARDFAGAALSLVERWGDAALVAVVPDGARTPKSQPASLLLVRSEAGWWLRAVFP